MAKKKNPYGLNLNARVGQSILDAPGGNWFGFANSLGPQAQNGGGNTGGGSNFNPGAYYDQLASMYRAQGAAEASGMRDSIRQMMIGMGMVPGGFKDQFGALDDATRALIQKNTETGISTLARLNEQKGTGIRDAVNQLAARGLGRSGAKGFRLRKNQLAYDRNLNDVMAQLMQQVGGMYSNYNQNEYARQAALIQAAMNSQSGSNGSAVNNPSGGSPPNSGSTSGSTFRTPTGTGQYYDGNEIWDFGGGWKGY